MLTILLNVGEWQAVDTYESEPVNLNFKFTEVTEINRPASSYSQSFRLPMTARNQDVFGAVSFGHVPSLDYKTKIPARIVRGGITLVEGFAQVKNFYFQRGAYQDIELVIFGEVANLSRAIGNRKLQDLNLSAYNFVMNSANTTAGLSSAGLGSGRVRLGVVDRFGFTDELNPFNGSLYFTPADFTPFVRASFILDEIMTAAGLTWESNFLQSATFAKVYLMALSGEKLYTLGEQQTQAVSVGQDTEQTIPSSTWTALTMSETSPFYDDISAWSTDTFTAPVTGAYRFVLSGSHTATIDVGFRATGSVGGTMFTTYLYPGQQNELTMDLELQAGETLQFSVYAATLSTFDVLATLLLAQYYQTEEFTLDLARNLPDMRQIEFVSGLQKMFNLVFIADRNRPTHFYIEPWSNYMDSGVNKDWTSKIDASQDILISPTTDLQQRKYTWTHTKSEDVVNASSESATNRVYGAKVVEDSNNDFAAGELEIRSPFSPFIVTPVGTTGYNVFALHKLEGDSAKAITEPRPFLAFFNGLIGGAVYFNSGGSTTNKPLPHYSANEKMAATLNDLSLHYGHPAPYHFVFTTPINALYYRWWSKWANELFSSDARVLEAWFALTANDIAQMEWSDRIYLYNQYWRILEIRNYDATKDNLTKVRLLKVLGTIQDCDQLPSTGSRGLIQGTPTSLTKKCCERYGFVYDPTTKRCYQPTPLIR